MIIYPEAGYLPNFTAELIEKTKDLSRYPDENGHQVNYHSKNVTRAYALNATLLHDPWRTPEEIWEYGPSEVSEIMLVERASGDGIIGSFNGVTGYIDTPHDPATLHPETGKPIGPPNPNFDPIAHTLREEFETECGFTAEMFGLVAFYAGEISTQRRTRLPGDISVVPILGLCTERPEVTLNPKELASLTWGRLKALKRFNSLSPGYLKRELPSAVAVLGIGASAFKNLLR